ncbi:MAG TPA: hypothetical protein PK780_04620, partial [Prevotella sp.]|nr:hypothetical protein [Prevotella sp.]
FQNQKEVDKSGQPNARVGGLKYKDLDGKNGITSDDQTWIFDPVPAFSYGLNIALNYKGFDFSMFWQGVGKRDMMLRGELIEPFHENYSYNIFKH